MADNEDGGELLTVVKNLVEDRAEDIIQRCQQENLHTVDVLKQIDNDGLKFLGFKLGDVAKIRSSLIKPDLPISRSDKIKELIENISNKRKAVNTHGAKQKLSHGRHKVHTLFIGWKHCESYEHATFKMRQLNQGGGIRAVEYDINEPQTVNTFIDIGKKLSFPNGESSVGPVEERMYL